MYKETIVIAGLGSELCNIDQESMVIMHLKDDYSDELPAGISEKLAYITRDVSHTDKQVSIIKEEQNDFREFLHYHYWDNDFKMGLVYVEDQESTWKNLNLNHSPILQPKYPQGWEWIESIPSDQMKTFIFTLSKAIGDDGTGDIMEIYKNKGKAALAQYFSDTSR